MASAAGCFANTRVEARRIVGDAIHKVRSGGMASRETDLVAALEALGLLKFEAGPIPVVHHVPCLPNGIVDIREDTLIETLRMAGYEISKDGVKVGAVLR